MRKAALVLLTIAVLASCARERDEDIAAMPVRTEVAKRSVFAPSLTLTGVVRAEHTIPLTVQQRGIVSYPSRFAGGLRTGETVRAGETLAELRNEQLGFSSNEARLRMEEAEAEYGRIKRSFDLGISSGVELSKAEASLRLVREQYKSAMSDVANLRVVAPSTGRLVVTKPYAPGSTIDAGAELAQIATGGAPAVECTVAASDRALLKPGLAVHLADPIGSWRGSGRIVEVASVIDANGTARMVARIDDTSQAPPPGSGLTVDVELERKPDALTVPEDAIVAGSDGPAVFVASVSEGGWQRALRVRRVDVQTGGRANGRVEVRGGLRDGDRVVVSGADALSEDAIVVEAK